MSARNGDKARFNRRRKARIRLRTRMQDLAKALKDKVSKADSAKA